MNEFKPENFVIDKVINITGYFLTCPNCGWPNSLDDGLEYCPECGTGLTMKFMDINKE